MYLACRLVLPEARQMATPIALASVVYLACRLVLPEARQMATPIVLASVVYLACRLVLPEARQMATPIDVSSYRPPMKCDGKLVSASSPCLPGTGRGRTGDGPTFPERTPTFPKRTPTFPECTPAQYFVP